MVSVLRVLRREMGFKFLDIKIFNWALCWAVEMCWAYSYIPMEDALHAWHVWNESLLMKEHYKKQHFLSDMSRNPCFKLKKIDFKNKTKYGAHEVFVSMHVMVMFVWQIQYFSSANTTPEFQYNTNTVFFDALL